MQAKSSPWTGSFGQETGSVFQPHSTGDRIGKGTGFIMSQVRAGTRQKPCEGFQDTFPGLVGWLMALVLGEGIDGLFIAGILGCFPCSAIPPLRRLSAVGVSRKARLKTVSFEILLRTVYRIMHFQQGLELRVFRSNH
jgi:hypothetical protein